MKLVERSVLEYDAYRPRLSLRFGITGHRPPRLRVDQYDTIKAQCADLFALARATLDKIHLRYPEIFASEQPQGKLVSSLAEGADVLAAEAALESGLSISACLPFPPDIYAGDFENEQWQRTEVLIEQADNIMSLSGFEGGDEAAYELAGRLVLSQSDILIAVWDGAAARGRGGTTQVIAEAVALHQPVLHIDATGQSPPELLWSGLHEAVPDRPSLDAVERAEAEQALPRLIAALCEPPSGQDLDALAAFVNPQPTRQTRVAVWPLLIALTGAKSWRRTSFSAPDERQSADWMRPHTIPFASNGRFGQRLNGLALDRFGRADAQASDFALRFRSSFVTNFALAGLAVLLALSGLLLPDLKLLFIAAELMVILLIIANTHSANRLNLHQGWLDRRHLAERLRLLAMSSPLGRLSLRDVEDGTTHPGWVSWYSRATAREVGLARATFDGEYLASVRKAMLGLIDEQLAYHLGNSRSMHMANHRLHKAGDLLFVGTIMACAAYFLAGLVFGKVPSTVGVVGTAELVTFITALFPALAAALYGIRMQGDFAATGERSSVIASQLAKLRTAIEADPLHYERLVERSRRLGDIMLAEVKQWRLHYETRPLSLPG